MSAKYEKLHLYPDSDSEQEQPSDKDTTSGRLLQGITDAIEGMADKIPDVTTSDNKNAPVHMEASQETAVFAIYGAWGTGKTTFMRNLYSRLENGDKVAPVWFNLWEHEMDVQPIVAMLQEAAEKFKIPEERDGKPFLKTLFASLYDTAGRTASQLTNGLIAAPSASQILGYYQAFKENSWLAIEDQTKRKQAFLSVVEALRRKANKPIVFFVDDPDRCIPRVAVDLLEKIRLYLTLPGCIFVIGADDQNIRRAVGDAYMPDWETDLAKVNLRRDNKPSPADADQTPQPISADDVDDAVWMRKEEIGREYLNKMVQHAFYLPPLGETDSFSFLETILQHNKLPKDEKAWTVLSIGLSEANASRRQIIRACNAFTLNYYLSEPKIDQYRPSITAFITVVQVLHPETYERLRMTENRGFSLRKLFPNPVDEKNQGDSGIFDSISGLKEMIQKIGPISDDSKKLAEYLELSSAAASMSQETSSRQRRSWKQTPSVSPVLFPSDEDVRIQGSSFSHGKCHGETLTDVKQYLQNQGRDSHRQIVWIGRYLWRVLHCDQQSALLITEHVIGLHPYSTGEDELSGGWKQWAADALAEGIANPTEQMEIKHGLHLLTVKEIEDYLPSSEDRVGMGIDMEYLSKLIAPELSRANAGSVSLEELAELKHSFGSDLFRYRAYWWWTDSEYGFFNKQRVVYSDGDTEGSAPYADANGGIRPVLDLKLG